MSFINTATTTNTTNTNNKAMTATLLLTVLLTAFSSKAQAITVNHHDPIDPINPVDPIDGNHQERALQQTNPTPFTRANAQAFVDYQIDRVLLDCNDFLLTFAGASIPTGNGNVFGAGSGSGSGSGSSSSSSSNSNSADAPTFEYCEGDAECHTTSEELLAFCETGVGAKNRLHTNLEVFPSARPRDNFEFITFTGKQTICFDIGRDVGFGRFTPLCFDFIVRENLEANPDALFGMQSNRWDAFYNINFGSCPGFEADMLDCSDAGNNGGGGRALSSLAQKALDKFLAEDVGGVSGEVDEANVDESGADVVLEWKFGALVAVSLLGSIAMLF